jgi:iron complex outermembrane recepter protein
MKKVLQLFVLLLFAVNLSAQDRTITGTVTDADGAALIGATVVAKGSLAGTTTDVNGKYSFRAPAATTIVVVSYTGFATQEKAVSATNIVDVQLKTDDATLGEVVISVGSRASQRTIFDSPLPIDVLGTKDLQSTGQMTFDKALQYRVPSFNTVNTPVNDATSLLDPYEIRNMGPSRTLILVNGKRKNLSALMYLQTSPGRGESGADISAIPQDAIKRVEILRDGASAQYGSDAIAGVMNIILKDRYEYGSVNIRTGVTAKGDGEQLGVAVNNGVNYGEKGYLNYTVDFSRFAQANRPGKVDADGEYADFVFTNPADFNNYVVDGANDTKLLAGQDIAGLTKDQKQAIFDGYVGTPDYTTQLNGINGGNTSGRTLIDGFLAKHPDAGNINGQPETTASKFLVNAGIPIGENSEVYANAAYVYKKVNSFANYRTPYWRTAGSDNPYSVLEGAGYDGYVPTFIGDLNDYNASIGIRSTNALWTSDVSFTTGGNKQSYVVGNSRNRSLGINTPLVFHPGGYGFSHNVGNIDLSRNLLDNLKLALGTEFRTEKYTITAGDTASYSGRGADSFPGIHPENSGTFTRNNFGGYAGLGWDVTKNFLLDATARLERYSDFGNAFVWKISSRFKPSEKMTVRGSVSTGFRAPTLHQINLQISQASFVPGQGIQTKGVFNNSSLQAKVIGVEKLKAEKSQNFAVGLGLQPNSKFNITLDYYLINVKDRIILGSEIGPTGDATNALDKALNANGIVAISFFTNAINTSTSGLDFVANYRGLSLASGRLGFNLAGNYQIWNKLENAKSTSKYESGDVSKPNGTVNNPALVTAAGKSVLDVTAEALMLTSRPKYKAILGADWSKGKFGINLNNTLMGPTTFRQNGLNGNVKTVFQPKILTDLGLTFQVTKNATLGVNANNLLNVLPEYKFVGLNAAGDAFLRDAAAVKAMSNAITFNQRYSIVTYDGSHFSQLGTILTANLTVKF